jgi:tetratricopeptide (TPR) repeat protein
LAEEAKPQLMGARQAVWLAKLETEHENLRAALGWSFANSQHGQAGARLAVALIYYWRIRNHIYEARQWMAKVLQINCPDAQLWTQALNAAAFLAWWQGDHTQAHEFYEKSLVVSQAHGFAHEQAAAREGMGDVTFAYGEFAQAIQQYAQSLALYRGLADHWGAAQALLYLGRIARRQGEYAQAIAFLEESEALFRALGDEHSLFPVLMNLIGVQRDQGDHVRADRRYQECLALAHELGDWSNIAWVLTAQAEAARRMGDYAAAELLKEGLALYQELGEHHCMAATLERQGLLARNQENNQEAEALIEESRRLYRQLGARYSMAWSLHNLGAIARGYREYARAC